MDIDIASLSEDELIALNHLIVAQLRFLREQRAHAAMLELRVGQRVTFQSPGRSILSGVLTRYNKKTVTVVTDTGEPWRVAPNLLQPAEPEGGRQTRRSSP